MGPVVTPAEMQAIDAEAPESVETLIARAGWATARAALALMGSGYGRRVAILAGKGNNGADGRAAVPHLERSGVHCTVYDIHEIHDRQAGADSGSPSAGPARSLPPERRRTEPCDLIIDACYGTGLGRPFDPSSLPIAIGQAPVLAVDIPSGVDGLTGQVRGQALAADATVTFAAWKPGLLLPPGRWLTGPVTVADIGLDCSRATIDHLGQADLARWPRPLPDDHKWRRAVAVIGGSPGMSGAPRLASAAALRAGAGYAMLCIPGTDRSMADSSAWPVEAVQFPTALHWADDLTGRLDRVGAVVIGPGLDVTEANQTSVARWLDRCEAPVVVDAGAITALSKTARSKTARSNTDGGRSPSGLVEPIGRPSPAAGRIITPHDGEYQRLAGRPVGPDRIAAARDLAVSMDVVVVLKGPTTIIADPDGRVGMSTAGDARLATAGTGDVLAGVIAAGLVGGLEPFWAAALGVELHGRAARQAPAIGLVASDLIDALPRILTNVAGRGAGPGEAES